MQCENFYKILSIFDERFGSEKRRRGVADYGDLERYAYRLLYNDSDRGAEFSEAARTVAADYDEIYVDEYQDVNELQDMIFRALSKAPRVGDSPETNHPRKRFMVGDAKQSIYGFRGAAPSLFAAYRADPAIRTLFLRSNFRSDDKIIGFVNRVSKHIFAGSGSEVDYGEGDRLVCGKHENGSGEKVKVVFFKSGEHDKQLAESERSDAEPLESDSTDGDQPDQASDERYGEADYVADEAARLIGSGKYKPGDIAILLRNASGRAAIYESALKKRGIGAEGSGSDFFGRPEILLVLCLLNCVNNPHRDIYLAGALRSPLYGFTFDELILIRRYAPRREG